MNKKVLKIVSTLLMIIMLVTVSVSSFADGEMITPGTLEGTYSDSTQLQTIGQRIIGFLQTVGVIISVIILIVIGIKYMLGSAEEKAEYKKTLMPYFIGAILIFAASAFAQAIYDFVTGFSTTTGV